MNYTKQTEREKWFIERVGKRLWRNRTTCKCEVCESMYQKGIIISDEQHADYVCMVEHDYNAEGVPLKYFDTKEERDKF